MLAAALADGSADRRCSFEVFARGLPVGRRYGVVAGTGRLLDLIESFRFGSAELQFLRDRSIVDANTLDWLEAFTFDGDIWGYGEGEAFFPGSPVLIVEASFGAAVLLETLVLSVLNHDSAVAAAAARMKSAARGRRLVDMGARRTHEQSAVAAARAAWVAGFDSTSDLEAGRSWGIPTTGTSGHAFVLLHDDEETAFETQVRTLGAATTMLVDTYDVAAAVRKAIAIAGPELGAVRVDSGDLGASVVEVRALLDSLGATSTRIVVTGDLDEYRIEALAPVPVDAYGAGTSLVTGSGAPTAGMVYKLAAVGTSNPSDPLRPVAKKSSGKQTRGGRKDAVRVIDVAGAAVAERISVIESTEHRETHGEPGTVAGGQRGLLAPLVVAGSIIGREPLQRARDRHAASMNELPGNATDLAPGDPAVPSELED